MLNIRTATLDDLTAMVAMARKFWEHTWYDEEMDDEHVLKMLYICVTQGIAVVATNYGNPVGFGVATMGPLLANPRAKCATELAWWLDPEFRLGRTGLRMLQLMESEAKAKGVKYFSMIAMESSMPEQVTRIYQSQSYKLNERLFTKVL